MVFSRIYPKIPERQTSLLVAQSFRIKKTFAVGKKLIMQVN